MDFQEYVVSKVSYPANPTRPLPILRKGTAKDAQAFADAMVKYEADMAKYKAQKAEWMKEDNRLREKFKVDALAEVGLTNHPKADKIFQYAWNNEHSSGYSDVYHMLEELAGLFID